MYILAIDPGVTTGIAVWDGRDDTFNFNQIADTHLHLYKTIRILLGGIDEGDQMHLICERFEWRKDEAAEDRTKIDYTAAEMVGVVKLFAQVYPGVVELEMQGASQAVGKKAFWGKGEGDKKIKKLGLWRPGQRHAMDALRHLLYYRVFTLGHKEILEKLK